MSKPRRHQRANGGRSLRGRRKAEKRREYTTWTAFRKRGAGRGEASHIEPERRLVGVYGGEDA